MSIVRELAKDLADVNSRKGEPQNPDFLISKAQVYRLLHRSKIRFGIKCGDPGELDEYRVAKMIVFGSQPPGLYPEQIDHIISYLWMDV